MEAVSTKAASIKILDRSLMKNFHERRSGMAYPVNPVTFQATPLQLHIFSVSRRERIYSSHDLIVR